MPRLNRTNHAVRTAAFFYCLVTIGLHFWGRGASPLAWGLLVLQFAVYPHLVYLRARKSFYSAKLRELEGYLQECPDEDPWRGVRASLIAGVTYNQLLLQSTEKYLEELSG